MPFNVGDLCQVAIEFKGPLDGALNVRTYRVDAVAGTGTDPQTAAIGMFTALGPDYVALMPASASYYRVRFQKFLPVPRERAGFSNQAPLVGTSAGDLLPKQACGLLLMTTGLAGPRYTSRVYVPFPSEFYNDADGVPTALWDTNIAALGATLAAPQTLGAGGNTITISPVVFHRDTATATAITSYALTTKWATQKRRNNNRFSFF